MPVSLKQCKIGLIQYQICPSFAKFVLFNTIFVTVIPFWYIWIQFCHSIAILVVVNASFSQNWKIDIFVIELYKLVLLNCQFGHSIGKLALLNSSFVSPFNIYKLDIPFRVDGVLLEVDVLEVRVHVEAGRSEVVGPGDVRHEALAAFPDVLEPHPHVPIPHLQEERGV